VQPALEVAEEDGHRLDAPLVRQVLQPLLANPVGRNPARPLLLGLQVQLFQLVVGKGEKIPLLV
jgi:hypothetical protein